MTHWRPVYTGRRPNPDAFAIEVAEAGHDGNVTIGKDEDKSASSLRIMGDEVAFFPAFDRAKGLAENNAEALEKDGWKRTDLTSTALDFVVQVLRGEERSSTAKRIAKELGDDAPIVCPKDFLLVYDVSGRQRRACDFYICRPRRMPNLASTGIQATARAAESARKWHGSQGNLVARGVALPDPPWQRLAQVDELWYRRHAIQGLGARYEHPYRPHVPLFVNRTGDGWRIALPNGCLVDERGFVSP